MNFGKKALVALAAFTMAAAPMSAQAASSLSTSSVRAGAENEGASQLGGDYLIPLLGIIGVVIAVFLLIDGDDTAPTSP